MMPPAFVLPKWYDLHAHFRQDELFEPLIAEHKRMGCAGALAMPNTKPPVACIHRKDETPKSWSLERYLADFQMAWPDARDLIVPLYLTSETSPKMIEDGARSGLLRACKYYPPHATTNSEFGSALAGYIKSGVIAALEDADVVLCVHGERHGLKGEAYFGRTSNAEEVFYREELPQLVEKFPRLRIVCEHVTTKVAVDFVRQAPTNVAATVTPQHLLYTVGDLLQGFKYQLYCLPLVKFDDDLQALRRAVTQANNAKFFAGTDSAPHSVKATACGCAAGCFTGGVAPQLYAEAFEKAGIDLSKTDGQETFRNFLCANGINFYRLPKALGMFTLSKTPQEVSVVTTAAGNLTPLPLGMRSSISERAILSWSLSLDGRD